MMAYLNGVPVVVTDPQEYGEWEVEAYKFVTDHRPTAKRLAEVPVRYVLTGLLVGPTSLVQKEILKKAMRAETVTVLHPLWGIKTCTCTKYSFKPYSYNGTNAYNLEMEFLESPKMEAYPLQKMTDVVSQMSDILTNLGAKFYAFLQPLLIAEHNIRRVGDLLVALDGFFTSPQGIVAPVFSLRDNVTFLLQTPKKIFEYIADRVSALTPKEVERGLLRLESMHTEPELLFVKDTVTVLAVCALPELTSATHGILLNFLDRQDSRGVCDTKIFSHLWERSLEKPQVVARPVAHGKPSLVASYETSGKLDLELELAHAAKQPFKV